MKLNKLYQIIEDRKNNPKEKSYVSSLFKRGNDRIIQKIGEEATEVVIAAKNKNKKEIISEIADLLFHTLVLLSILDIKPSEVELELKKRRK